MKTHHVMDVSEKEWDRLKPLLEEIDESCYTGWLILKDIDGTKIEILICREEL